MLKQERLKDYALISVMPGLVTARQCPPQRISQVPLPAAWLKEGLGIISSLLPTLESTCKGTGRTLGCFRL